MNQQKSSYNYDTLADRVRKAITDALELAKEHLQTKKLKNKHYYDKKSNDETFEKDDLVLVRSQVKKDKFQEVYEGPFRVIDVEDVYVKIMRGNKITTLHKNLIKKAKATYTHEPPVTFPVVFIQDWSENNMDKINNLLRHRHIGN